MNLHIQKDPFHRGTVIWVDEQDGIGPYLPAHDPYKLASIDKAAEERLRKLLDIAEEGNWGAYGVEPAKFAAAISSCLETILKTGPADFAEAKFVCPSLLAQALSFSDTSGLVGQWFASFPSLT